MDQTNILYAETWLLQIPKLSHKIHINLRLGNNRSWVYVPKIYVSRNKVIKNKLHTSDDADAASMPLLPRLRVTYIYIKKGLST